MKNFYKVVLQNAGLIIISLGLLFGGVAILRTPIPFWNLFYGLPATFLGIITSLISFNEIAKNRTAKATEYHQIPCKVCGKQTLAPMLVESIVCSDCQLKMARRLQLVAVGIIAFVALPVSFHLAKESQDMRNQAKTQPSPMCEAGLWKPEQCQCGVWDNNHACASGQRSRTCGDKTYCCYMESESWNCILP